jgi:bis(5'-nucleosidyl)-tetraphosphatase
LEFLIISNRNDGHWGFTKGHVEKDESEEETAIREVCEETGLQVILINEFRISVEYPIKQEIMKEVVYFLARATDQIINIQLDEIVDYKWASFADAKATLSYQSSKHVLDGANEFISTEK